MNITVSLEELSIKVKVVLERDIRSSNSIILALITGYELDTEAIATIENMLRWKYCPNILEELIKQKNISAKTIHNIVSTHVYDSEGIMGLAAKKAQTDRETLKLILYRTISMDTFRAALVHPNILPEDIAEQMYNSEYAFKSYYAKDYLKKPSTSADTISRIAKCVAGDWGCESILLEIANHPHTDTETLYWLATNKDVLSCFCFCNMTQKLKDAIANNPNLTEDIRKELKKI